MKKLAALLTIALLGTLSARATVLFQDFLNYPNGIIETDGVWQVYSPAPPTLPSGDAAISNKMIILKTGDKDAVEAPYNNNTGSSIVYASFSIVMTALPSSNGSYFIEFQSTNDSADVAHLFAATKSSVIPGTYRLGIANFATSSATTGVKLYPLDLATNIAYDVVMSYDPTQTDPFPGATLVVNPASQTDFANSPTYATDNAGSAKQLALTNSALGLSPFESANIGNVSVGTAFSDVFTFTPAPPVIGIQPQGASIYSGNNLTLYTAASGLGPVTYQWYSNNVALADNGVTVIGSTANILQLNNLQLTANYSVTATDSAGSTPSAPATITINNTLTAPFFTTQPKGVTNGLGSTIILTSLANGTGPLTYEWYFQGTNAPGYNPIASGATLTLGGATYSQSGTYYVTASGGDGSQNSSNVLVQVTTPPLVTIGFLHSLLKSNNVTAGTFNLSSGASYTVQGVVTSIGAVETATYSEYFVQDATGGALAFVSSTSSGSTNVPPVGSLVQIVGVAQQYYGQLELVPNPSVAGTITILSNNVPLPAPVLLNVGLLATNTMGAYGLSVQGGLVTGTNLYLYATGTGTPLAGATFPTNASQALYAFAAPYSVGQPYVEVYLTTYTNALNQLNTNFFGQLIPTNVYQLTGAIDLYSTNQPELVPSRYQDFVVKPPARFNVGISSSNGVATLTWPASIGSTYSVYSSTNVSGPWTQTFGLSYYPSTGSYSVTNTNSATSQFFFMSTP
ncbi:MAG TPA: hypothetical protein VFC44_26335 [Candidatus Saccharimonadales bacterium]|nr:hypothetical protein [Candidatus Saccharimonadales bacterium]